MVVATDLAGSFGSVVVVVGSFLIAVGSALVVALRTKGIGDSVDLLQSANTALREVVTDMQTKADEYHAECDQKLLEQKTEYTAEINRLNGKLDGVTEDLAARIILATSTAAAAAAATTAAAAQAAVPLPTEEKS